MVVAAAPLHRRPPPAGVLERLVGEAGLADARLALDDHEVGEPAEREVDAGAQPGQFGPPPDQRARHRPSVQVVGRHRRGRVHASPRGTAVRLVTATRARVHDVPSHSMADGPERSQHVVDVTGVGQRVRHEAW